MEERILIAGAGGQGALTIGKFLATVAMKNHLVTFFPSYGAEVRGGTAHCHVVISGAEIANPVVDEASVLIVLNQPSYRRFIPRLRGDGLLVLNSSMVRFDPPPASGRQIVAIPATQLATEMGDIRVANVILLGVLNTLRPLVNEQTIMVAMEDLLGRDPTKAKILDLNKQAYRVGVEQARRLSQPAGKK